MPGSSPLNSLPETCSLPGSAELRPLAPPPSSLSLSSLSIGTCVSVYVQMTGESSCRSVASLHIVELTHLVSFPNRDDQCLNPRPPSLMSRLDVNGIYLEDDAIEVAEQHSPAVDGHSVGHLGRGSAVVGRVTPPSIPAIIIVPRLSFALAAVDGTLGLDGGRGWRPVSIVAHVVLRPRGVSKFHTCVFHTRGWSLSKVTRQSK